MKIKNITRNEDNEIYIIKIVVDNPGKFIRELWESLPTNSGVPTSDEDACREWTDRSRDFRTSVSSDGLEQYVYIRTHAWHPSQDQNGLHKDVLGFLYNVVKPSLRPVLFGKHRRGDNRRFHARTFNNLWQVYGVGLTHVCECQKDNMADMVADSLEEIADLNDSDPVTEPSHTQCKNGILTVMIKGHCYVFFKDTASQESLLLLNPTKGQLKGIIKALT